MVALAVFNGLFAVIAKYQFGVVATNVSLNMRKKIYRSILSKHIGWHDNSENATGILSGILAQDVQLLNGVSTEVMVH